MLLYRNLPILKGSEEVLRVKCHLTLKTLWNTSECLHSVYLTLSPLFFCLFWTMLFLHTLLKVGFLTFAFWSFFSFVFLFLFLIQKKNIGMVFYWLCLSNEYKWPKLLPQCLFMFWIYNIFYSIWFIFAYFFGIRELSFFSLGDPLIHVCILPYSFLNKS